jgi:signal transduction histidine kinase
MAHDANNVLMAVMRAAEMLTAGEAPVVQLAATILDGCSRLTAMVRHLMGLSGGARQTFVDVNDVIAPLVPSLRCLAARQRTFTTRLDLRLPPVRIRPIDLERAVLNLLSNARDATSGGGRISLSTSLVCTNSNDSVDVPRGRWVLVEVQDNGSGVDEAMLARAFEPYFTTKPPHCGTGLGLTSVLLVVRAASGHVRIHSRPGEGTRVQLWLPVPATAALEEGLS